MGKVLDAPARAAILTVMTAPAQDLHNYGARYFEPGETAKLEARSEDLYYYRAYFGAAEVQVERGDCVYFIGDDSAQVFVRRGPYRLESKTWAVVVRGYMPENKSSGLTVGTLLPYVNGCSTRQIFPPERPGDPTLQLLYMPAHSSEQVHHVHSTVRVVHVLSGSGTSVVGLEGHLTRTDLRPGMSVLLERFCPHHFTTGDEPLLVLPLHVFSSIPGESRHPMYLGTHGL